MCAPPAGLPVLPPPPSSMRAAATTPAEPVGVRVVRFPTDGSLPRRIGGSASASAAFGACSAFTRVAARMVAEPPRAALLSKCFRRFRYLHHPLQLLPAGTTVAGRALHPLGDGAFPRRTMRKRIHVFPSTRSRRKASNVQRSARQGAHAPPGSELRSGVQKPLPQGSGYDLVRSTPLPVLGGGCRQSSEPSRHLRRPSDSL